MRCDMSAFIWRQKQEKQHQSESSHICLFFEMETYCEIAERGYRPATVILPKQGAQLKETPKDVRWVILSYCVCMYVCVYVCVYVCMYVCMDVCMYVSIFLLECFLRLLNEGPLATSARPQLASSRGGTVRSSPPGSPPRWGLLRPFLLQLLLAGWVSWPVQLAGSSSSLQRSGASWSWR